MKKILALIISVFLSACTGMSQSSTSDPVNQALKICGLGYDSEISAAFQAAYIYAEAEKGANFEAKMREGLETQLGSLAKNEVFVNGLGEGELFKLIKEQQNCVVKYTSSFRPNTESEMISACMEDLRTRLEGNGSLKKSVSIKNWFVVPNHPKSSNDSPVVRFTVSTFRSDQDGMIKCISKNNVYQTMASVVEKG